MKNDLTSLVRLSSQGQLPTSWEVNILGESIEIGKEHFSLFVWLKEVESIIIQDTIFEILCTLNQQLLILPCNRAVIAELREWLFNETAVHMQVSHLHWLTLVVARIVTCEILSRFNVSLNLCKCTVLNEPLRFIWIDFNQAVVVALEERSNMWKVLHEELYASGNYCSDAAKLLISSCVCPLVCFLDSLLHEEYVCGNNTSLGHKQSLISCLGEIFEDPPVKLTVLHLDTLDQQTNHHIIFELSALTLHVLSQLFSLWRVLCHELLDDVVHLKMYNSDFLREYLAESRLSWFRQTQNEDTGLYRHI